MPADECVAKPLTNQIPRLATGVNTDAVFIQCSGLIPRMDEDLHKRPVDESISVDEILFIPLECFSEVEFHRWKCR